MPPWLIKGRGTPTTGIIPITINTLIKIIIPKNVLFFKKKEFEKMSKTCMNLVDGKGAIRITNVIRKL